MLAFTVTWPDDIITVLSVLGFVMITLWWRHRYPMRYDLTLHLDKDDPEAKKNPPEQD